MDAPFLTVVLVVRVALVVVVDSNVRVMRALAVPVDRPVHAVPCIRHAPALCRAVRVDVRAMVALAVVPVDRVGGLDLVVRAPVVRVARRACCRLRARHRVPSGRVARRVVDASNTRRPKKAR